MKFINKFKSPNFNNRNNSKIKFIIIHYTALRNSKTAIKFLCDKKNKVSSHFLISQNGSIYNLVDIKHRAWHAGNSAWMNYKNINSFSIGIELDFSYEYKNNKYNSKMIISLKKLLKYLIKEYKLKNINILGHSDIAPFRKIDPGPSFPWYNLSLSNLVFYPSLKNEIYLTFFESWFKKYYFKNNKKKCMFILKCIGYDTKSAHKNTIMQKKILLAYQAHYMPSNVSGKFDQITTKYLMGHYLNLLLTKI